MAYRTYVHRSAPRPQTRPATPRRQSRPKGPDKTPPILPETHGERRYQLKATYTRLSRIVHKKVQFLRSAKLNDLYELADDPQWGTDSGLAFRLIHKIARLRALSF